MPHVYWPSSSGELSVSTRDRSHKLDVFAAPDDPGDLARPNWHMPLGERAALVGLLEQVQPSLALELGTASGGSLTALASFADEVHTFDLAIADDVRRRFSNVTFHEGDSHALLPPVLAGFVAQGRNVDFVLVDGDHSAAGVRLDIEQLLASPAIAHCLIVLHDTANEDVRAGVEAVDYAAYGKVVYVHHDAVPGAIFRVEPFTDQIWGGFGIIIVGEPRVNGQPIATQTYTVPGGPLLRDARAQQLHAGAPDTTGAGDAAELTAELQRLYQSRSWRFTAPLRRMAASLRGLHR